jgi:hypothetical protein
MRKSGLMSGGGGGVAMETVARDMVKIFPMNFQRESHSNALHYTNMIIEHQTQRMKLVVSFVLQTCSTCCKFSCHTGEIRVYSTKE